MYLCEIGMHQMAFNVDLSMEKVFFFEKLCSGIQLEFGLEAQNPFNHPVFWNA